MAVIKNNKRRGAAYESKTKTLLEKQGYYVFKTAVSDTNPDIIAFKDGIMYLIEVKSIADITKPTKALYNHLIEQIAKYRNISESIFEKSNIVCKVGLITWCVVNRKTLTVLEITDAETADNAWINSVLTKTQTQATEVMKLSSHKR
ncbi:Holliday junction resolvase [Methanococcus maripaludis]|uniref:Holliday junction resolvase n=1 Tax=Methanococcus maripaludis TaxID=39152 RepID=A0A7J9NWR8_METMI|nr:hypothetical protein [Methanococcus maripaludis]MBA2851695.1 Holliday junction resolvase [Methanococcus maripaludis]